GAFDVAGLRHRHLHREHGARGVRRDDEDLAVGRVLAHRVAGRLVLTEQLDGADDAHRVAAVGGGDHVATEVHDTARVAVGPVDAAQGTGEVECAGDVDAGLEFDVRADPDTGFQNGVLADHHVLQLGAAFDAGPADVRGTGGITADLATQGAAGDGGGAAEVHIADGALVAHLSAQYAALHGARGRDDRVVDHLSLVGRGPADDVVRDV